MKAGRKPEYPEKTPGDELQKKKTPPLLAIPRFPQFDVPFKASALSDVVFSSNI